MSKTKTSRPDSSATKVQPLPPFDKLYWLRVGFAALAGLAAEVLVGNDYVSGISLGIAMYLVTYYVARFTWYRGLGREVQSKIYTTGIGTFALVFFFTWILLFTVQIAGFPV